VINLVYGPSDQRDQHSYHLTCSFSSTPATTTIIPESISATPITKAVTTIGSIIVLEFEAIAIVIRFRTIGIVAISSYSCCFCFILLKALG
jgi:hypothetical protein